MSYWKWWPFCLGLNVVNKCRSVGVIHLYLPVYLAPTPALSLFGLFSNKCMYGISYCLNLLSPNAAYMRQWIGWALVKIMACRPFGAKPLSKSIIINWTLNWTKIRSFYSRKCARKLKRGCSAGILTVSTPRKTPLHTNDMRHSIRQPLAHSRVLHWDKTSSC